jgi:rhodanese-related sulfurtransferase
MPSPKTIDLQELKHRLQRSAPDNQARLDGYAFIFVESREKFLLSHIPGSANIPGSRPDEFERKFDREKRIVLYGEGPDSSLLATIVSRLTELGFQNLEVFSAGFKGWKEAELRVIEGSEELEESTTLTTGTESLTLPGNRQTPF